MWKRRMKMMLDHCPQILQNAYWLLLVVEVWDDFH